MALFATLSILMTPLARYLLLLTFAVFACSGAAADLPDIVIFDDNPENGLAYDPSFAESKAPSALAFDGIGKNKLPLQIDNTARGRHAAVLRWTSRSGGSWRGTLVSPHWAERDARGYSRLSFKVNGPVAIPADKLPAFNVGDGQGNRSKPMPGPKWLPAGLDADPGTWQEVSFPIADMVADARFNLARFRSLEFSQGAEDDESRTLWVDLALLQPATAPTNPPSQPKIITHVPGDRSVNLYWEASTGAVDGYAIYRAVGDGPFSLLARRFDGLEAFTDTGITNGVPYRYRVTSFNRAHDSTPSEAVATTGRAFGSDGEFLDYLQQTGFWFFWQQANPTNGLVRDRSHPTSFASIAATGFGLTALGIGIDHGWISRALGAGRTLNTLKTFAQGPQSEAQNGTIGHKGWFYHFLNMNSAARHQNTELSSIDTALLLGGVVYAREFFNDDSPTEREIRQLADLILSRIDWEWMCNGEDSLTMGWHPESGFIKSRWIGYNEAMLLYVLALGSENGMQLGPEAWQAWTKGYEWKTSHGLSFLHFEPLFGHQYSHVWIDFRGIFDGYMSEKGIDYFENSRRATLAQQQYAIANPNKRLGYGEKMWGFTACDGPGHGNYAPYMARGAPPAHNDDGTIAPTAPGGSIPFAPEICIPTLRNFYESHRAEALHPYGFVDAFNLEAKWFDGETLGIDQGPIVLMIENHRTGKVWKTMMQNAQIKRGLDRAGFRKR